MKRAYALRAVSLCLVVIAAYEAQSGAEGCQAHALATVVIALGFGLIDLLRERVK